MHTTETQLKTVAQEIKDFQDHAGLSDAALVKDFADLGSTKTYKRILEGDFSELNVERQLNNYQRVLELTKIRRDPGDDAVYKDLRHVRNSLLAVKEAYREKSNDRLVIIEGGTGSGKTWTLDIIQEEFPQASVRVDAHGGWKIGNNPLSIMLGDILNAANIREYKSESTTANAEQRTPNSALPVSFAERKNKLFAFLNERKRILLLDEGHEMGPFCLNLVKTIINQTPTIVVLAVYPTLFRRLESRSYDDCIQLTGNRLYERIRIPSPAVDEIEKFLERRGVKFEPDEKKACLEKLAATAPALADWMANWKFIRRFAVRAKQSKGAIDAEQCVEHIRAISKARKGA
jgi:hypothetical protein